MLGPLYLLALQVELVPLVPRVEVVCVDDVVASPGRRLKALVRLAVIRLQELLEVKVGGVLRTSVFLGLGSIGWEFLVE